MLKIFLNKYRSSKSLLKFFFLTYLDKIISFALPLAILFIVKDKGLYTFVEVAFSYATLAVVLADLGFSNYLFFGYKKSDNREKFLEDAQFFFKFILLLYCLFLIPCLIWVNYYNPTFLLMFGVASLRTLFLCYTGFYSNIFRLTDRPSSIYLITISVNILSFVLLLFAHFFNFSNKIIYFFLPSLMVIIVVSLKYLITNLISLKFEKFFSFAKEAMRFSWPIILNVLAMSYINNYAKIYAYGNLSENEMIQISFIMRIGLVIQLTHSSFSSFFSKSLFMDVSQKFNMKIFKQYNGVLVFSVCLVLFVILITNAFFSSVVFIPFTVSTALFLFYIVLWCYIGYLELYYGVMNANKKILYYSIASSLIYTLLLKLSGSVTLFQLALFMVISALVNLTLVVIGLIKLKVFNFASGDDRSKI